MKNELESHQVQCPYCWQSFELLVDCSVAAQSYVEDCEVCCRPIVCRVSVGSDSEVFVEPLREDD